MANLLLINWLQGFGLLVFKQVLVSTRFTAKKQMKWMTSRRQRGIQFYVPSSCIVRKRLYGRSWSLAITNPNPNINDLC